MEKLRSEQGVEAFVTLLHQGGSQRPPSPPPFPGPQDPDAYTDVDECQNFNGPEIQDIAAGLDPHVGVIISAHTHQPYICTFSGKLVTSAASFGRVVTDVELTIDGQTKAISAATADNKIVTRTFPRTEPRRRSSTSTRRWPLRSRTR